LFRKTECSALSKTADIVGQIPKEHGNVERLTELDDALDELKSKCGHYLEMLEEMVRVQGLYYLQYKLLHC
jgi:hypothetical protein